MMLLMQTTQPFIQTITENTQVSLWLGVVVAMFVLGVVLRVNNKINSICNRLTAAEKARRETWTVQHQKIFALQLQIANPSMHIPDPYLIAPPPPDAASAAAGK